MNLAVQERNQMIKSESIKEIAKALSALQGEIQDAKIDSKNPHFNSEFASLEAYLQVIRPLLAKHGLSITQGCSGEKFESMLMHTSGEYIIFDMQLINEKKTMQGLGSAISYARRYSIGAELGIGQEDDDAEKAQERPNEKGTNPNRGSNSSAGSGNRNPGPEKKDPASGNPAQIKPSHESKAQAVDPKPQVKDETPITIGMAQILAQIIESSGKNDEVIYTWMEKTFGARNPMNLKKWQYEIVMQKLK